MTLAKFSHGLQHRCRATGEYFYSSVFSVIDAAEPLLGKFVYIAIKTASIALLTAEA
jgi:hypothetical protein